MKRRLIITTVGLLATCCGRGESRQSEAATRDGSSLQSGTHQQSSPRQLFDDDEDKYLTTCISPYPGYVADARNDWRVPMGDVKVVFDGGMGQFNATTNGKYPGYDPKWEFTFHFDLMGLPPNCNGCRIQINEGQSCDEALIRFWDRNVTDAYNPWRPEYGAVYHSDFHGFAKGKFSMFDGFDFDEHKRRTVVVFSQDHRERIGCGVLRRKDLGVCTGGDPMPSPTPSPTAKMPSPYPSSKPVPDPVPKPVPKPVPDPTSKPSPHPSSAPSAVHSKPTQKPVPSPSGNPTMPPMMPFPTFPDSNMPTPAPVVISPSAMPTIQPTMMPTMPTTLPDIPSKTAAPVRPHPNIPTRPDSGKGGGKKGKGGSSKSSSSISGKKKA